MRRTTISMTLRETEVNVDVAILPPEPEVGIMGPWFEDEVITDMSGNRLDWELDEEEIESIGEKVCDSYYSEE